MAAISGAVNRPASGLPNPDNDARDMSAVLRRLGFDVTTEFDADRVELTDALRRFTRRSAGADVSLVIYAGHGIEMDGVNYLVPVDARLEDEHPGAAASIREGLHETLTVLRLGLTGSLQRTLRTTNIIENLNSGVERYTRNVKRWRGGQMIQRWVASALLEAEQRFRRVRGYRDMRHLIAALDALAPPEVDVEQVA